MIPLVKLDSFLPESLALNDGEVHVWYIDLDRNDSQSQYLYQILSPDEQARADRYRFDEDKRHFITARGLLRTLLSRYLHTTPAEILFVYNSQGKPAIRNNPYKRQLMFNVSHSYGTALYAITQDRNIGIDVELIRDDVEYDEIAQRFFSQQETSILNSLPSHLKSRAFYNCWTRKEAYIKALGEGLKMPLDKFSVTLSPGEPAALLYSQLDPNEPTRWSLYELDIDRHHVCTLAVEGETDDIKSMSWS